MTYDTWTLNNHIHSHQHFTNRCFIIDQQIARNFVQYSQYLSYPRLSLFLIQVFQPTTIKGRGFSQSWNPYTLQYSSSLESLLLHTSLQRLLYCCETLSNTKLTSHHHIIGEQEFPPHFILNNLYPFNAFQFDLGPKQMILKSQLGCSLAFHLLYFKEIIFNLF